MHHLIQARRLDLVSKKKKNKINYRVDFADHRVEKRERERVKYLDFVRAEKAEEYEGDTNWY